MHFEWLILRLASFDTMQGWKSILQFSLPSLGDHEWWGTRGIQHSFWEPSKAWNWWATFWDRSPHRYIKRLISAIIHWGHEEGVDAPWSSVTQWAVLCASISSHGWSFCTSLRFACHLVFQLSWSCWWIVVLSLSLDWFFYIEIIICYQTIGNLQKSKGWSRFFWLPFFCIFLALSLYNYYVNN